jgi:hypothetical protein
MDGITSAHWSWSQASVPIAISGLDEKKNSGEAKIIDLLEAKVKQADMGLRDFFNTRLLIGAGGTSITSAYTSTMNGSSFIDPLPLLIDFTPTSSTVVGNINQSTHSWWQNQTQTQTSSNYAGFLKELRTLRLLCGRGPGGKPDLHLVDENVYTLYEAALAAQHRNPSYSTADIPFDNILFYKAPVVYDQQTPDASGDTATISTNSGTWYMINSAFFQIQAHAGTNFASTPFVKPENQDAKVAHILWLGGVGVSNRRKHGVAGSIDTTMSS